MLSANGSTKGEILRPSDGKPVKTDVSIQCTGSRGENHLPYCSKICYMYTAKQTPIFKERIPDGEAYIDVRVVAKVMDNSLSVLKKNSKPTTLEKGFHGFIEIRMEN